MYLLTYLLTYIPDSAIAVGGPTEDRTSMMTTDMRHDNLDNGRRLKKMTLREIKD
jgi:hypothetical protein